MDELGGIWQWFADTQCRAYSPLYDRICRVVAADPDLLALVRQAPPEAHQPNVLLAAVHYLLLGGLDHPLAEVYAGRSGADPGPLFRQLCLDHRQELLAVMATRRTQTNECGRSAVIGPALTLAAGEGPVALVDVGASAGLNLRCDRYRLDYGDHGATGPADAAVRIECRVVGGRPPIAPVLPAIVDRVGIDRSPIDVGDDDDARWLLACVWPDTGRLARTASAIEEARRQPARIVTGDAVDTLPGVVAGLPAGALACVVTTWVLAYFSAADRQRFVDALDQLGRSRPVAWIVADGAGVVDALGPAVEGPDGVEASVLGLFRFDRGGHDVTLLGHTHPHGVWLDWRA
jgi:hypothetical protein